MHTVYVSRRFGEWHDIREFIRPNTIMVSSLAKRANQQDRRAYLAWAWRLVVEAIKYPPGPVPWNDYHTLYAYRRPGWFSGAARRYATVDWWNFPEETLRDRMGDCEDKVFLLVSLLRRNYSADEVWASAGLYDGMGHMWVSLADGNSWRVLETTLDSLPFSVAVAPPVEAPPYRVFMRFNDERVMIIEKAEVPRIGEVLDDGSESSR